MTTIKQELVVIKGGICSAIENGRYQDVLLIRDNGRLIINIAAAFFFDIARGDNGGHNEDKENDKDHST